MKKTQPHKITLPKTVEIGFHEDESTEDKTEALTALRDTTEVDVEEYIAVVVGDEGNSVDESDPRMFVEQIVSELYVNVLYKVQYSQSELTFIFV